jgi:hypothetical protein
MVEDMVKDEDPLELFHGKKQTSCLRQGEKDNHQQRLCLYRGVGGHQVRVRRTHAGMAPLGT